MRTKHISTEVMYQLSGSGRPHESIRQYGMKAESSCIAIIGIPSASEVVKGGKGNNYIFRPSDAEALECFCKYIKGTVNNIYIA